MFTRKPAVMVPETVQSAAGCQMSQPSSRGRGTRKGQPHCGEPVWNNGPRCDVSGSAPGTSVERQRGGTHFKASDRFLLHANNRGPVYVARYRDKGCGWAVKEWALTTEAIVLEEGNTISTVGEAEN